MAQMLQTNKDVLFHLGFPRILWSIKRVGKKVFSNVNIYINSENHQKIISDMTFGPFEPSLLINYDRGNELSQPHNVDVAVSMDLFHSFTDWRFFPD